MHGALKLFSYVPSANSRRLPRRHLRQRGPQLFTALAQGQMAASRAREPKRPSLRPEYTHTLVAMTSCAARTRSPFCTPSPLSSALVNQSHHPLDCVVFSLVPNVATFTTRVSEGRSSSRCLLLFDFFLLKHFAPLSAAEILLMTVSVVRSLMQQFHSCEYAL